ncbi:MAG: LysM peptidoglycan-binding domain-containing protein [Thermodesulfobacteriota bacterium]
MARVDVKRLMLRLVPILLCLLILCSCSTMGGRGAMGKQASDIVKGSRVEGSDSVFRPGPQFEEELREKVAAEFRALEGKDQKLPLTLNEDVKAGIEYFLTDARRFMINALSRSGRYMPMLQHNLRKKGLPPDLAYLVLIESGFRVDAVSPASAGGLWQFIPTTGRRYGLKINDWVDERMHPEKATLAAADYLADLHEMFGSWPLAAAAYNCGEGKIQAGLKKHGVTTYWELSAIPGFLPEETRRYVPLFLAAVIIAKDPARFGLTDLAEEKPEEYDEVEVNQPTDLDVIARLVGSDPSILQRLNPHLKLWCTPLDEAKYTVKVPKGAGEGFAEKYAALDPQQRFKVSFHVVKPGESLQSIAAMYQLSALTLQKYNGLGSPRVYRGQKIRLPVDAAVYVVRQKEYEARATAERQKLEKTASRLVYKVKPGDNAYQIARRYDVSWQDLTTWNNIKDVRKLQPGDELVLYLGPLPTGGTKKASEYRVAEARTIESKPAEPRTQPDKPKEEKRTDHPARRDEQTTPTTYKVQSGDTIYTLAQKFDQRPETLMAANELKTSRINPGQVLNIPGGHRAAVSSGKSERKEEASPARVEYRPAQVSIGSTPDSYTVQSNDTLWKISQRFKVKPEDIRAANHMKDNNLQPGQVLKLPAAAGKESEGASSRPETIKAARTEAKPPEQARSEQSARTEKKVLPVVSYKVQNGDTLWKISQRFKVNPAQIRLWNNMKNDHIHPGLVLTIKADQS